MNYQTKINTLIRANGFNSFSLHKYFIRSVVRKLKTYIKTEGKLMIAQTLFRDKKT